MLPRRKRLEAARSAFKQFRLVPKQFDYLVNSMRVMMDRVRTRERSDHEALRRQCKMPKKNFITLFTGNETSETPVQCRYRDEQTWSENCTMSE